MSQQLFYFYMWMVDFSIFFGNDGRFLYEMKLIVMMVKKINGND